MACGVLFTLLLVLVHCGVIQGERTTHLHFYFHEIYSGPNATAVAVVNPPRNDSAFGAMGMVDDMLKEGPDPSSKLIGRAQGLTAVPSMEQNGGILTMLNFVFTDGPYNGSTLAVFGRAVLGTVMERAIIGGTGRFRMARGYTLSKQLPSTQGLLVLEYDAYISH
ncbi:Dirigent protein [Rhynchospora pubera]|uniref:Dirigent protein n=2 Tax=Rhynchospora pubera TaxID=906938 RepID=A0AAV8HJI3_9POAL|nr:Dirigent protein [Rhynchospora pubera]KAJ4791079.1 Dirigent protein [Rhynchospora pubera]KAJ4814908.1 Dirigent protein [Rhynchospora pubera]KAJ4814915.1 Dirigent protein [Rhynchospora pubera]